MGANASTNVPVTAELYMFEKVGTEEARYTLLAPACRPRFYVGDDDVSWRLYVEVEGGDIDVGLDAALGPLWAPASRRVTFKVDVSVFAMRFPTAGQYDAFHADLLGKTAVKTTTTPDAGVVDGGDDIDDDDDPIRGILMGSGEDKNTYLMQGTWFDVLRPSDMTAAMTTASSSRSRSKSRLSFGMAAAAESTHSNNNNNNNTSVILSHGESRTSMLCAVDPTALHHADIEAGKVVSTWRFEKEGVVMPMRTLAGDCKAAQLQERSTFLGLDSNRLCRWDMRDKAGVVSLVDGKGYSRGTNFTCMATSGDGHVVVGSSDGKVRLYRGNTIVRAMTAVPGYGAPITACDVTYDGRWVLATTDKYLVLIDTVYTTDKGADSNGFVGRMGDHGKQPRFLRLRPDDALVDAVLSKAKFTWVHERGTGEGWLVACYGHCSCVWSMDRPGDGYVMHAHGAVGSPAVVDTHSRVDASLVVTTPQRVFTMRAAQ